MVKILCYGHSYISSNLVRVIVIIFYSLFLKINLWFVLNNCPYSSKVEQNTVNICIDVRIILRAYFKIKFNYSVINVLFLLAQW